MKNELKKTVMFNVKRIHFIGIGGSGMSGIASILCDLAMKYLAQILILHQLQNH